MFALSILKDKNSWPWIVKGVGKVLLFELKHLCSIKVNSVLRRKDNKSIKRFPWEIIVNEVAKNCPTLYCTSSVMYNYQKELQLINQKFIVVVIISILSKFRCTAMSLFQKMVSMILYAGHAGNKVQLELLSFISYHSICNFIIDL